VAAAHGLHLPGHVVGEQGFHRGREVLVPARSGSTSASLSVRLTGRLCA
jgi:hypothetical protein